MKERKLVSKNTMSEDVSKDIEKLTKKVREFAKKKGLAKFYIYFESKECGSGNAEQDYINVTVHEKNSNKMLDISFWK